MKRIAVLTSGGDAPGMNAAIRAVTRVGIYRGLEVVGIRRGYEGLLEGDAIPLTQSSVGGIIHHGGTILRTARSERFKRSEGVTEGFTRLKEMDVDALVVIGGEGSFKGAWELEKRGFPTVGVPGTIDNDCAGTDETIGYDTAVNTALEAVKKLRDTASSHDRLFIIEVMGRNSGFIALQVALAGGAECVLLPEVPFDVEKVCQKLNYAKRRGKTHSLIIVAEGVMSAQELAGKILDTGGYESRITVLGHIQRGGSPTAFDAVLGSRLGAHAVEALLEGKSGVMAGVTCGQVTTCPLPETWENKKRPDLSLLELLNALSI
ncbi:MAG TPA: 6-phosphofructokinase [Thermosynergistes sp.]|nr:6-phosphofructokinase [Thermosynergistes sp.]HPZ76396.1 6-phosphofructokinase [Thermosynergistes sp.]HQE21394.1 6-phosphofructokinase [Thermosynergistes sp.]